LAVVVSMALAVQEDSASEVTLIVAVSVNIFIAVNGMLTVTLNNALARIGERG
jgi:hypothetical protein